jgi:2-isopropylmalate synthase
MANTLEAIELGVQWISSSINGIGERAGITDTCLLLANLHYKAIRSLVPTITIKEVSDFVAATLQSPVDEHRPATGQKIFSHVADLHVKAMKKNASAYNWIDPELLGHQTALIEPVAPKEIINQFSKKVV